MTAIKLIEIMGFTITLISVGIAIGKQVERLDSKNKKWPPLVSQFGQSFL